MPVLSLSAKGALMMERVVVPVGKMAMVLNGGPGAAIILRRANASGQEPSPAPGQGQWGASNESMSPRARAYLVKEGSRVEETYHAGAYWGPRKESPESRKDALTRPIEPTRAALEKLIRRGRDRQFEDLGYSVWAWNGVCEDYDDSGFHIQCSGYSKSLSNVCVFNLPTQGPNAERVLSAPVLTGLLRSTAMAWEPDWGVAMSTVHRDLVDKDGRADVWVGWVTYLSRRRGRIPPLPAPVRIEPVEDKGTLIILTPERFTAANPEQVALSERVRELLDRAGLLGPPEASRAPPTT
jgi:hypothetical protein